VGLCGNQLTEKVCNFLPLPCSLPVKSKLEFIQINADIKRVATVALRR